MSALDNGSVRISAAASPNTTYELAANRFVKNSKLDSDARRRRQREWPVRNLDLSRFADRFHPYPFASNLINFAPNLNRRITLDTGPARWVSCTLTWPMRRKTQPHPPAPAAPPLSRGKIFFRRLFSSVILWTIVLLAIFSKNRIVSDYFFLLVMILLSGAGLVEFYDLARKIGLPCYKGWGIFGGLLLMTATFLYLSGLIATQVKPAEANDFETTFLILFVLGLCVRQFVSKRNPEAITAIATTLFGLMYVPWLLNFIQKINFYPRNWVTGKFYVLHFILVTKFSDLGAYVTGSLIGKHKMIPRISPGKTWEGFGGRDRHIHTR